MKHLVSWRMLIGVAVLSGGVTLALSEWHAYQWVGDANATVSALDLSGTLGSMAVLAVAAWLASSARRRGLVGLESSTVRWWARRVVVPAVVAVAGLAGLAVGFGVMAVQTLLHHPVIPIPWLDALPIAMVMPVAGAMGYAVGRMLPWPPLAIATAPAAWAIVGYFGSGRVQSRLFAFENGPLSVRDISPLFSVSQSVMFAAFAVALVLLQLRTRWVVVPVVVAVVAVLPVVGLPDNSMYRDDPLATKPWCVSGAVDYCATAVEKPNSAATIAGLRDALQDAASLMDQQVRFVSENLSSGFPRDRRIVDVMPWTISVVKPSPALVEANVLIELVNPHNCPMTTAESESGGAALPVSSMGQVVGWLYQVNHLPTDYLDVPIGNAYAAGPDDIGTQLNHMTPDRSASCLATSPPAAPSQLQSDQLMVALKARSFRTAVPVVVGTWLAVWVLTRAPMPFITVEFISGIRIPSGILLTGMFSVASTYLFRDVTNPVSLVMARPSWHERAILIAVDFGVSAVGVAGVLLRLRLRQYVVAQSVLVIGNALGLFGLTLIFTASLGAIRGATCVVLLIIADFAAAIFGINANFNPANSAVVFAIGAAVFVVGLALALIRGLDPGRSRRGDLTAITDL